MKQGKLRTLKTNLKSFCEFHKGESDRMIECINTERSKKKFYLCHDCFNAVGLYRFDHIRYREMVR